MDLLVKKPEIKIGDRKIGELYAPFIIAEIGINHEGSIEKAKKMISDAYHAGAECVKFQSHIIEDEMISEAKKVIPGNTNENIYDIMKRCSLTEKETKKLKHYTETLGMTYLCTPFSRAAANRLEKLVVNAYKIGSGECNNYPLVKHIANFGKPIILSTGMNNLDSIAKSVEILEEANVPHAILQCTSMYPTPYDKINLGALKELKERFPNAVIGFSDHSLGIYASLGAISLGASIIEKHFTSDKSWPGPDVPISIDPIELKELIEGSKAIHQSLGGSKLILEEEQSTIDFAYASVVTTKSIKIGEPLTKENLWVKRPGTGEILADEYENLLGKTATKNIKKDIFLNREDYK